ncbi:hypothetical protein [Cohnella caldifontis]|uniref:hypothetical protein n=1 Tax=Cohnella caldifontis TaxID=3027471 RepID=UPI0023ED25DE|nr:hypothetical protein [Cohnella sp. YIM B05605]
MDDKLQLNEEDEQDYLPRGHYLIDDGHYYNEKSKGKFLINKIDLLNCEFRWDTKRLNGCCGADGCDGINQVCINKHEIGTLRSDCWMPHAVVLEPANVKMNE